MPLPRFHKLEPAKQKELLDAAAAELAEKGFDGACIAAIVERAGASKSAVYYYFEDKADLFQTVLSKSIQGAIETVGDFDHDLVAADFWGAIGDKKMQMMRHFAGRPSDMAIWRLALNSESSKGNATCMGAMHADMRARWGSLLEIGRTVGAVRTDITNELAIDLLLSVDGVMQQHLIGRTESFDSQQAEAHVVLAIDMLRRILSPASETK